jgi:hypothetical protein
MVKPLLGEYGNTEGTNEEVVYNFHKREATWKTAKICVENPEKVGVKGCY